MLADRAGEVELLHVHVEGVEHHAEPRRTDARRRSRSRGRPCWRCRSRTGSAASTPRTTPESAARRGSLLQTGDHGVDPASALVGVHRRRRAAREDERRTVERTADDAGPKVGCDVDAALQIGDARPVSLGGSRWQDPASGSRGRQERWRGPLRRRRAGSPQGPVRQAPGTSSSTTSAPAAFMRANVAKCSRVKGRA